MIKIKPSHKLSRVQFLSKSKTISLNSFVIEAKNKQSSNLQVDEKYDTKVITIVNCKMRKAELCFTKFPSTPLNFQLKEKVSKKDIINKKQNYF